MSLERSVTKEQAKEFLESYSIALGDFQNLLFAINIKVYLFLCKKICNLRIPSFEFSSHP
jgi:hypothetical protein